MATETKSDKKRLTMRDFKVTVIEVPPMIEVKLFGARPIRKTVTIKGYTLKDAKRRAGIQ